jgi:hypothetical protein
MIINKRLLQYWAAAPLILLLGATTGCTLGRQAVVSPCFNDAIETSPGIYLPMNSGRLYEVYLTDNRISMGWRPTDKVVVCPTGGAGVQITNLSEKEQKVQAVQVFDTP